MRKTFRRTNWVLVLLASGALLVLVAFGALVTAYRSSSDEDQSERKTSSVEAARETAPSKGKRTQAPVVSSPRAERATSPASERATHVAWNATHPQAKAHAKAEPGSKESYTSTRPAGEPARTDPVSSMAP